MNDLEAIDSGLRKAGGADRRAAGSDAGVDGRTVAGAADGGAAGVGLDEAPDLSVLSWCADEIGRSLRVASDALRRQLQAGPEDASALRAARVAVHQAHGALAIVGLSGVPMLTTAAEQLLDAIEREALPLDDARVAAFSRACGAIGEYLEELLAGAAHQPLYLFPYYRDLMLARGAERVHAADLFVVSAPAAQSAAAAAGSPGGILSVETAGASGAGAAALAAARSAFERGLLKLLRDPADRDALHTLRESVDTVLASPRGAAQAMFWRAAQACFEAWRDGALAFDVQGKRLLARINLQMRHTLADGGPVADRLLAETLFVLAGARGGSPLVREVREAFRLDEAIPDDYETPRYGLIDAAAVEAGREALAEAKRAWESSSGAVAAEARLQVAGAFAHAVALVPFAGLQKLGAALLEASRSAATPEREADEALALEVATALLFAEQMFDRGLRQVDDLDDRAAELAERVRQCAASAEALPAMPGWMLELGRTAQERITMSAFVAESRSTLQTIEQGLDTFFRDSSQSAGLPAALRQLQQLAGALRLLGHEQAGDAAAALVKEIEEFSETPPTPADCERVAGSLGALGFFIDGLLAPGPAGLTVSFDPETGRIEAGIGKPVDVVDAGSPARRATRRASTRRASAAAGAAEDSVAAEQVAADSVETGPLVTESLVAESAATELAAPGMDAEGAGAPEGAATEVQHGATAAQALPSASDVDPELLEIFLGEAVEVLDAIDEAVALSRGAPSDPDSLTAIRRGFHTLKGSGRMVGLGDVGEAAWAMEQVLNLWLAESRPATPELHDLIAIVAARFRGWIDALRERSDARIDPAVVIAAADAVRTGRPAEDALAALIEAGESVAADSQTGAQTSDELLRIDDSFVEFVDEPELRIEAEPIVESEPIAEAEAEPEPEPEPSDEIRIGAAVIARPLYEIFLAEADSLIGLLVADADAWAASPSRPATEAVQRAMHSLKGSASVVSLRPVQALAEHLENFLLRQRSSGRSLAPDDVSDYAHAVERLQAMLHTFAAGQMPKDEPAALTLAHQLAARWDAPRGAQRRAIATETGDLDADLLPLFIEEAIDILPQIGENLRRWQDSPADRALQQLLMRQLHTIKGSARMAGAMVLGQRVHEMETRVEAASGLTVVPSSLIEELIAGHDAVVGMFEGIRNPGALAIAEPVATGADEAADSPPSGSTEPRAAGADADETIAARAEEAPETAASTPAVAVFPVPKKAAPSASPVSSPVAAPAGSGLVRVRADLLDLLVNESGEVSIARSRLDNELSTLRQSLQDLTENVGRLRSQLREIEIQAESQIQSRTAHRREKDAQFDPLEFDRYTRFQELTRMLAESVNDVATVQQSAMRSLDGASQDMIRQGQVLRELQQNLMRMRMVQFGSVSDRLYRVVRQAAKELGKRVSMDVRGASVEIDRGVLERMSAPIEHLLRNAVAHGIEPPAGRAAAGKSEAGEIRLEVRQEGNEVVLVFADDGGGLDTARIIAKARASGLLADGRELSEREAAELIFQPGFSTAGAVDEISGRGVGLDVVRTEVASLGGRIDIDSTPGAGTRFTVHLPLTLALAQVVLVSVGPLKYAIPSSNVEQVLQVKPQALADAYSVGSIDWQGARVPMHYLGTLVDARDLRPVAQHLSPIVVIRSANQRIAVHADTVSPTQEVVVKNVGPQVARVRGIGGATVMGNGEIVLILNAVRLAQAVLGDAWLDRGVAGPRVAPLTEVPPSVMVVDDSVTVRKVTQRLLAREGYDVMLAKDGVDALRQLQDRRPDVMLVDIEMPRMDGFDLTRNLRGDERFRDIPIVMITSRTADKHRNYAMSLGVNVYLGKPYRDDELLRYVAEFTRSRATKAG